MPSPISIVATRRLDAWVQSPRLTDRFWIAADLVFALAALGALAALVWRLLAGDVPAFVAQLSRTPWLTAAAGYLGAAVVTARLPSAIAHAGTLGPALADEALTALSVADRGDFEAVVRGAVGDVDMRSTFDDVLADPTFAETIEDIAAELAEEDATETGPEVVDSILGAFDDRSRRAILARYLAVLLSEETDIVDDIARPVTKKLLKGETFFGESVRPFSWKALRRRVRRFLETDRGRQWTHKVVARVLADLREKPARAAPLREVLAPAIVRAASGGMGRKMAPRVAERLGESERLTDELTRHVEQTVEPALLGALDHVVNHRAAAALEGLDPTRTTRHIDRAAALAVGRLRGFGFALGAGVGLLIDLAGR